MNWYNNLYLGEGIAGKADLIINRIKDNQLTPDVYVIAEASNPENLLDIIPSWELLQKGYPKEQLHIIGLAAGKAEALSVVQFIVEEVYQKTGNVDIRTYLRHEWEGQA